MGSSAGILNRKKMSSKVEVASVGTLLINSPQIKDEKSTINRAKETPDTLFESNK